MAAGARVSVQVGAVAANHWFSTDCTKLFSLTQSEFMGPGWAACPWQHCRHSCVADILPTARAKRAGVYPMSKPLWLLWSCWLSLLQVQEVLHSNHKGSICKPHHVKSRTLPHTQENTLSCWQNNVSDLEVQMLSWKGRRFSWFKTVITSHKYILAWVGRLHKEIAALPTPTGLNFAK